MSDDATRDKAYAQWRDHEVDDTGTLPDAWGAFNAGWEAALAPLVHDHIDDGSPYLDCRACYPPDPRLRILDAWREVSDVRAGVDYRHHEPNGSAT